VWYSRRLIVYVAGGKPSGGIRKKKTRGGVWNARYLVVHTTGAGNDEVGVGGTIGAPSLFVVAENPLHILPSSPPLLAVAPVPFSLPSYMPFESVTWRYVRLFLMALGAGDMASVAGVVGGVWGR
jgi:hypothetical protein